MGQFWQYHNLDKKAVKFGGDQLDGCGDLEPLLYRLIKTNQKRSRPKSHLQEKSRDDLDLDGTRRSRFLAELPTELLFAFFDALKDDFVAVFCLSLANLRLYERRISDVNNWTGDRLVCLGDYYGYLEYVPGGAFTTAEKQLLEPEWSIFTLTENMDHSFANSATGLCVLDSERFGEEQPKYLDDLPPGEEKYFRDPKDALADGKKWKDVSKEVVKEIMALWV
ncbi:hypothetical protein EIP91_009070 [Steccherinum ochraceum]|uniref:Uncharacterized protein n=1 Tax=Steccherinum ochraceum TaxID=92696 RepID=A0A4R0R4E1_9APHY|nr:hypothetical protein EIP91_009070 [Steccherinum ochraceum]